MRDLQWTINDSNSILVLANQVLGRTTYYSHKSRSRSIGNGDKFITEIKESNFDSQRPFDPQRPQVIQRYVISPGRPQRGFDDIKRKQLATNNIGIGYESQRVNSLNGFLSGFGDRGQFQRGFITKARTVESPALSVDSGGRASVSIANEVAKLLNVKQGYYADVYDKIDRPKASTRRPAEVIEESMRDAVQHLFSDNQRHRHDTVERH